MNRWMAPLTIVALGACIDVNRPMRTTDDTLVTDTVAGDTGDVTALDTTEIDTTQGGCDESHPCSQPSAPCAEAVCEDGQCVVRQRRAESPCDDGNPCTGDGLCQGNTCKDGAPVGDGDDCDDGLYCNGLGSCEGGECVVSIVAGCPQIAGECIDHWACSEAMQGGCEPVPAKDASSCNLRSGKGECSVGACVPAAMVWIPTGIFTMGCNVGPLCPADARPAHDIALSAFAIDRTEVTEGMWRECVASALCAPRTNEASTSVKGRDKDEPLRDVDWLGARQVCAARGRRLCTEAEWEKAARGTADDLNFPWGNAPAVCERAVFHELGVGPGCGEAKPAKVGGRPTGASPYGVLDMAGNVAEWVLDAYDSDIYESQVAGIPRDPVNDLSTEQGPSRVVRGGGWATLLDGLRVFKRTTQTLTFFDDEVGVRCCWSDDDSQPVEPVETTP